MPLKLNTPIIEAAILGFEEQKKQIDSQIAELRSMLDGNHTAPAADAEPDAPAHRRKKFSAASRRKMAEAQRLRWAKLKGESEPAQIMPEPPKPRRKLSAAAKARLVANLKKARAAKAAKAKSLAGKKTLRKTKKSAPVAAQVAG